MKKAVLIICMVWSAAANAQLEKGNKLAGLQFDLVEGDIYYSYPALSFGNNFSRYGFSVTPTYGVALERNWIVGGQATLGFLNRKTDYGTNKSSNHFSDLGIGPFTRLYLDLSRNGKFKLYGMGSLELSYHRHKARYESGGSVTSESVYTDGGLDATLGLGVGYFGSKIAVDLNVSALGLRMGFYFPKINQAKK